MDMLLLDRMAKSMKTTEAVFGIITVSVGLVGRALASWVVPLFLLWAPPAMAQQWNYTLNNDAGITIVRYSGPPWSVTIPSVISGLLVTGIKEDAFSGCTNLTSVTIPDSVSSIGDSAFEGCSNLTSVTMGTGVTSIGEAVFLGCSRLTSLTIPNNITTIGWSAFEGCSSLTNVYFLGNAPSVGFDVFEEVLPDGFELNDPATVYYLPGTTNWGPGFAGRPTRLLTVTMQGYTYTVTNATITITGYTGPGGAVVIPSTINGWPVTCIGNGAFVLGGHNLTSVTIPDSVTNIAAEAFGSCTMLTSVTIPNTVTSIGDWAFWGCNLTSVTIPSSVTSIGDYAFSYCSSLTWVCFLGNTPSLGPDVFYADENVTLHHFPETSMATFASFGVETNTFGLTITGASGLVIVVEACTNLAIPRWSPVSTNTMSDGLSYFTDPRWANYRSRFYRLQAPPN